MAIIKPFAAFRPVSTIVSQVAALPYDVMDRQEAKEMAKNNIHSFLHVDKAEIDLPDDVHPYDEQVYQKARENLYKMMEEGVYQQDQTPSLYLYRLTMAGRAQIGIVGCLPIDAYLQNDIKKHELTRADKEQDRIRHVDTCNAHTGPIFLTYPQQHSLDQLIEEYVEKNDPVYDFTSSDQVQHEVWHIFDPKVIQLIQKNFQNIPTLYIADGHHRAASAVKVGQQRRKENPNYTGEEEFNFFLGVLFPHNQLQILDYNRVVKDLNGWTKEEFLLAIQSSFIVSPWTGCEPYRPTKPHIFGMYLDNQWYVLEAKDTIINFSDPVARLDVSILQKYLLHPILGIQDPRTDERIDFIGGIRGLKELEKRVNNDMIVAFSMYPTTIEELMEVADQDKLMPPKSTWFEPKLRSGIFIHTLD
ncbi:MAG: DUF1015 domain-containing protein [Epulopiscium sp.]|nr:DUF1015 domain-containing protein [Candidatus Epulonipiscium sp.]